MKIRDDYRKGLVDIWSTELLPFEVLNALRYNPELGKDEIGRVAKSLSKFRFALYPLLNEIADLCIEDSLKYGLSIYDSYLALSEFFDKELYTTDQKMIARVSGKEKVAHLKEY